MTSYDVHFLSLLFWDLSRYLETTHCVADHSLIREWMEKPIKTNNSFRS
jgi:hypothetical protein